MLRVIVAEDSMLVREGILSVLAHQPDIEVVAACSSLPELLEAVHNSPPDVVLTDIRMPPTGTDEGIRAAAQLRDMYPNLGVVVLSQYAEPAYAVELFADGSRGRAYLLKERLGEPDQLTAAIHEVADGGSVVDPTVVDLLVKARVASAAGSLGRLSPRELEVLAELAQGKNNAAVAKSLVISVRAVEKHINSLFSKLGLVEEDEVHRRVKAVLLYLAETS